MKASWGLAVLTAVSLGAVGAYRYSKRPPPPAGPKAVEKALERAASSVRDNSRTCASFFFDLDGLISSVTAFDEKTVLKLSEQMRQYPGIPRETRKAWDVLSRAESGEAELDVSFAFALSDCEYPRFLKTGRRLLRSSAVSTVPSSGLRPLASALLSVVREVLAGPVSRQALFESLTTLRELRAGGWIAAGPEEQLLWDREFEYLKQFNHRADSREKEIIDRVFLTKSFRDLAVSDRKGIAAQIRYSFSETQRARERLLPTLAKTSLASG
jgi:hypothetical protein